MAIGNESFNNDLYQLLKVRGYHPTPLNSQNQRVKASQEADVIEFTFTKDGEDYGKAWISIDDGSNVTIYFDDKQTESPSDATPGAEYDDTWTGFLKHVKQWAQRRQLSFELANKDRLGDDMRQRDYYKMKEKLGESYHAMGKKASYNDAVPNVKIVLQHNRSLEEGEARFRNVARIYLENVDGERFLAPTNKPGIARVYARHIAEGGVPNDEKWNHIKSVCEDYSKMAGFVRATRNGQFNESAQLLVNEGVDHYNNLRETLHKLTTHRGYQNYFESWSPPLMEDEDDGVSINELFVQETVDPRIESVMPILSRLHKKVSEATASVEVDALAEWADSIISEKLEMKPSEDKEYDELLAKFTKKYGEKEGKKAADDAYETLKKKKKVATRTRSSDHDDSGPSDTKLQRFEKKAKKKLSRKSIEEGDVIKFPKGWVDASDEGEDEMNWDSEDWIPSIEDFEQEEEIRNRKRGPANDLDEMEKDLHQGQRWDPKKGPQGPDKTAKMLAAKKAMKDARKSLDKAFKGDVDENFIGMAPQAVAEEQVDEDLGPEQKRVGQLGPTEKVKNNNIGKLVGASESKEIDPELARIIEMAKFIR